MIIHLNIDRHGVPKPNQIVYEPTQMTLEQYSDKILKPMMQRCAEQEAQRLLDIREDYLFYDGKPVTRWQRFKFKLARVHDAWLVLIGKVDIQ